MKYIILGKQKNSGRVGDDSSLLREYFELGWEVVGSRMQFIQNLVDKKYSEQTTFVTTTDRMFFYTKLWDKVISWESFEKLNIPKSEVEDWVDLHAPIESPRKLNSFWFSNYPAYLKDGKYSRLKDIPLIHDGFDFSGVSVDIPQEDFVVLSIRYRNHHNYRNSTEEFWLKLVTRLREIGINKIFVAGMGSESFCEKNGCIYLEKLCDFTFLIKQNNCLGHIGQSSGPTLLSFAAADCTIFLIDKTSKAAADLSAHANPISGGRCSQFFTKDVHHLKLTNDFGSHEQLSIEWIIENISGK